MSSSCDTGSAWHHAGSVYGMPGSQHSNGFGAIAQAPVSGSYASVGGRRGRHRRSSRSMTLLRSLKRKKMRGGSCGCAAGSTTPLQTSMFGGRRSRRRHRRRSSRRH